MTDYGNSEQPAVLTIAGFDPSGGAGIIADVKTIQAFGCRPAAAITSLTFQNSKGVFGAIHQSAESLRSQVLPIMEEIHIAAVKIGMSPTSEIVLAVARLVREMNLPAPVVDRRGAKIGFVAYGTTDFPLQESRHQLRNERGVETDYLRLRALPFTHDLKGFVADHDRVYVVEQNRDGQMADLIRLEVGDDQKKIRKILHYTGLPCDARSITNAVLHLEAKQSEKVVRIGVDKRVATKTVSED